MTIEHNIPLAPLTTFRIGGPARYFARAVSAEDIAEALAFAKKNNLKTFVLGGGSNVLAPDEGFDGLVIHIVLAGVERQGDTLAAAAGESWDALCARAVGDGLWGIENLSGIPGTVGGAVVQNIGAYGAALSQTLESVSVWDTESGGVRALAARELGLGYRTSVFKREPGRFVVLGATLSLISRGAPTLAYPDLAPLRDVHPGLAEVRSAVLAIRAKKFPDLAEEGTAGSFFLNPVLPKAEAEALRERFPGLPLYAMPETSDIKVPLGWLLDRVLGLRGFRMGEARLFERQALVIAASRAARASDVRSLAEKIKSDVRERIGIEIEEEVRVL